MVPGAAGAAAMMRTVAREQHRRPSKRRTDRGAIGPAPPSLPPLSLITGLPDDRREPLESHHALYPMASRLRREQDRLHDRDHRQRFMTALDAWPRLRGADSLRETQIQWAGMLLSEGWRPADVAEVLDVALDTLRRRRVLDLGETWVDEVLVKEPPVLRFETTAPPEDDPEPHLRHEDWDGSSRLPRVVEGRVDRSVFGLLKEELGDLPIGDACVNLPGGFSRPAELGYYRRLLELRRRRAA